MPHNHVGVGGDLALLGIVRISDYITRGGMLINFEYSARPYLPCFRSPARAFLGPEVLVLGGALSCPLGWETQVTLTRRGVHVYTFLGTKNMYSAK